MRFLRFGDLKVMPWKNGAGETRELAVGPEGATLAEGNFDWRVSIATISTDAPFSQFPGFDRQLVVWKGEGVVVNGVQHSRLEPFEFRGEDVVSAQVPAGPVQDFGVIFKRSAFRAEMITVSLSADERREFAVPANGQVFLLCAVGELRVGEFYLNPGDCVRVEQPMCLAVTALEPARAIVLSLVATRF